MNFLVQNDHRGINAQKIVHRFLREFEDELKPSCVLSSVRFRCNSYCSRQRSLILGGNAPEQKVVEELIFVLLSK